ncbi:hypothetical protein K9N50_12910 [bacterium]|nr:hypothetical protein [bacterium]
MKHSTFHFIITFTFFLIACSSEPPDEYFELSQKGLEYVIGNQRIQVFVTEEFNLEDPVHSDYEYFERVSEVFDSLISLEYAKLRDESNNNSENYDPLAIFKEYFSISKLIQNSYPDRSEIPDSMKWLLEEKLKMLTDETDRFMNGYRDENYALNLLTENEVPQIKLNIRDDVPYELFTKFIGLVRCNYSCFIDVVTEDTKRDSSFDTTNAWSWKYYAQYYNYQRFPGHNPNITYHLRDLELELSDSMIIRRMKINIQEKYSETWHNYDDMEPCGWKWRRDKEYTRIFHDSTGAQIDYGLIREDLQSIRDYFSGASADLPFETDAIIDSVRIDFSRCSECNRITILASKDTPWKEIRELIDIFRYPENPNDENGEFFGFVEFSLKY